MTNFQRNLNIGEVEIEGGTIYHKSEYRERRNHYSFYSINRTPDGFDTDRDSFIGKNRGLHNPAAVETTAAVTIPGPTDGFRLLHIGSILNLNPVRHQALFLCSVMLKIANKRNG